MPGLITTHWGSNEVAMTLGYAVRPWLGIRVQGNHGSEIDWESSGYHGPYDDALAGVFFSTEAKLRPVAAALVSVSMGPLHVGVGPSITRVEIQTFSPAEQFPSRTESRAGVMLELGAGLPLGRHLLLDLSLQRDWAGSEEIGPYPLHDLSGQLSTTFPATRVSFDHTSFKLGLGVLW